MCICLYMNQTYQTYGLHIADIFFHSICYLFILLIISFAVQKFLNLTFNFDYVKIVYFCLCCLYFWCHIHEIISKANVKEILFYGFFFF